MAVWTSASTLGRSASGPVALTGRGSAVVARGAAVPLHAAARARQAQVSSEQRISGFYATNFARGKPRFSAFGAHPPDPDRTVRGSRAPSALTRGCATFTAHAARRVT